MTANPDDNKPPVVLPPAVKLNDIKDQKTFLLEGEYGNLWFERRSPTLFVTFDNLATLNEPYPRIPWMAQRVEALGYSLLGVQSFRKDWFRQPTTSAQLRGLEERGFFKQFDRIIFMGTSMGAFGALNFAPIVPDAWVLAFSAQSTLNKTIAPFEQRYKYAFRKFNWDDIPFLDAAAAIPYIRRVALFFDPFVLEDSEHAKRLRGPNVQMLACPHSTHQAIRLVVKCDALPEMMKEYAETGVLGPEFWNRLRRRKEMRPWRRMLIKNLERRNRPKLLLQACNFMLAEKDYAFASDARKKVLKRYPELVDQ